MSTLRRTVPASRRWPCSTSTTRSSSRRATRSTSSSPSRAISLPRTWIATDGKAASMARSTSSRSPEEEGHEVVAGDGDLDLGARHDGAKATGRPPSPRRRSPARPTLRAWTSAPPRARTVCSRRRDRSWAATAPRRSPPASTRGWPTPGSRARPTPGPASGGCTQAAEADATLDGGAARPRRAPRGRQRAHGRRPRPPRAHRGDRRRLRRAADHRRGGGARRPRGDHLGAHRTARRAGRRRAAW